MNIEGLYDIACFITGGNLPPQYEFINAILTLVIAIVFVVTIFAPFFIVYKIFE